MPNRNNVPILKYLTTQLRLNGTELQSTYNKLTRYDDIRTDFLNWLTTEDYTNCQLSVHGYTAADIAELAPTLTGLGSFMFLVTLREHPDRAKRYIAEGFPIQ